jgi:hypothetical protein
MSYVKFDQAKWLKEKGFDVEVKTVFKNIDGWEEAIGVPYNYNIFENIQSAPEQWQVVEWLRVNHGVWICVKRDVQNYRFYWSIQLPIPSLTEISDSSYTFSSPQEAYSAAFDHIKNNNLI